MVITYPRSFPIFSYEGFAVAFARIQFPHHGIFCNEMLIICKTLFLRNDFIIGYNVSYYIVIRLIVWQERLTNP